MLDLDELEAKAKAATPGPWAYDGHNGIAATGSDQFNGNYFTAEVIGPDKEANGGYIAAANPAVVLDLIKDLREARAAVAAEREACAKVCDEQAERNEEEAGAAGADEDEQSSLRSAAWQLIVCAAAIRARGAKGGE